MHEGYVFLDEKCLLLAGEMLRELARYAALQRAFLAALARRRSRRCSARSRRHGLDGLQVLPAGRPRRGRACAARRGR